MLIELSGVRILTDPLLTGRVTFLKRVSPVPDRADWADIDLVLISHLHHDHCDIASLRLLGPAVTLVVPAGSRDFFAARGFARIAELGIGDSWQHTTAGGGWVDITAVPADHDGFRAPRGPRAAALGYVISSPQARVYFAGDTDVFEGMGDLATGINLALLPVWGWGPNLGPGHMNPRTAADAVELLRPESVVPIHWGTYFPVGMGVWWPTRRSLLHTPPYEFARAVRDRRLDTRVIVTQPGHAVAGNPAGAG